MAGEFVKASDEVRESAGKIIAISPHPTLKNYVSHGNGDHVVMNVEVQGEKGAGILLLEYHARGLRPEDIGRGSAVWESEGVAKDIDLTRLIKGPLKRYFD